MQKENIVEQFNLLSQHWNKMLLEMKTAQVTLVGQLCVQLRQELREVAQPMSQYVVEKDKITGVNRDKRGKMLQTLDLDTPRMLLCYSQYMIYTRDELSCGHKWSLSEMGNRFEGRKPIDEMSWQQWKTSYQQSHRYKWSLTEIGDKFEGREPLDGMLEQQCTVVQYQVFDGGGMDI